jgi:hypothetical protein
MVERSRVLPCCKAAHAEEERGTQVSPSAPSKGFVRSPDDRFGSAPQGRQRKAWGESPRNLAPIANRTRPGARAPGCTPSPRSGLGKARSSLNGLALQEIVSPQPRRGGGVKPGARTPGTSCRSGTAPVLGLAPQAARLRPGRGSGRRKACGESHRNLVSIGNRTRPGAHAPGCTPSPRSGLGKARSSLTGLALQEIVSPQPRRGGGEISSPGHFV